MEQYCNFDLELFGYRRHADQEGFRVRVAGSPAGEQRRRDAAAVRFDAGLRAAAQRLDRRQLDLAGLIELGERLAALLLPPAARGFLDRSRARLEDGEGLRIRIKLDSWTLADLPWEYAYVAPPDTPPGQEDAAGFLALDRRLSLVRYELLGQTPGRFEAVEEGPLRLVALLASPSGLAPLDLDRETAAIRRALGEARRDDGPDIRLDIADGGTLHDLERSLDAEAHLFHFAGHGHFDAEPGEDYGAVEGKGSLILEDASGAPAPVAAETLGLNLRGCGVRLAVLAACEGARRDRVNAWTGIAPALVRHGIPAVVAMQLDLRDDSAVAFSTRFYESLAAGQPVDAAVAAGRLAIFNRRGAGERDWGVPVLYLRAAMGVLFPRPEATAPAAAPLPPKPAPLPPVEPPPLPRRFWGNLALGLGVAGLAAGLYYQAVQPRLETGWLVGGGAATAAALLALLRWLAEDDLRTSARKWLKEPRATGVLAAALVVLVPLHIAAHLLKPVVVRLVPGTSLMPEMTRADRATAATRYTLRLRSGDRQWECDDLRKPGCAIGASESEVRIALARHRQPIEDRLRQYLIQRGVPEDLVDQWLTLWQLADPERDARPRLRSGDELAAELFAAGASVPLLNPVIQLQELAGDPVRVIFLEKEDV